MSLLIYLVVILFLTHLIKNWILDIDIIIDRTFRLISFWPSSGFYSLVDMVWWRIGYSSWLDTCYSHLVVRFLVLFNRYNDKSHSRYRIKELTCFKGLVRKEEVELYIIRLHKIDVD